MGRTGVRGPRAVLGVVAVAATMWAGRQAAGEPATEVVEPPVGQRYVVQPRDTLWELARGLVGPEGDPRPMVERIRESNDLGTSVLLAGDTLVLPAPP